MIARMKTLLALAALTTPIAVAATEPSQDQQRKVSLVMDFCGAAVAKEKADFEALAKRFPGFVLADAKPLAELLPEADRRVLFRGLLKVQDTDTLHFAGFGPEPPSTRNRPFLALRSDGEFCMVVGEPAAEVAGPLRSALGSEGSTWREDQTEENSWLWRREVPGFAQTLTISRDESLMVIAQAPAPEALAARVSAAASAALGPCLEGALTGRLPEPGIFAPPYLGGTKQDRDGRPGMFSTIFSVTDPGLRSVLDLQQSEERFACQLRTSEVRTPVDKVLEPVLAVIAELTGGKDFKVASLPARAPVVKWWRVSRASSPNEVDISVAALDDAVGVRIEPREGWDW